MSSVTSSFKGLIAPNILPPKRVNISLFTTKYFETFKTLCITVKSRKTTQKFSVAQRPLVTGRDPLSDIMC